MQKQQSELLEMQRQQAEDHRLLRADHQRLAQINVELEAKIGDGVIKIVTKVVTTVVTIIILGEHLHRVEDVLGGATIQNSALAHSGAGRNPQITGDACLTACHVASQVHIVTREVLVLTPTSGADGKDMWQWISPDEKVRVDYGKEEVQMIGAKYDLCLGGDAVNFLHSQGLLQEVVQHVQVYARVSPDHKELILKVPEGQLAALPRGPSCWEGTEGLATGCGGKT
ncbi:hypothetical protein CYMTET_25834 [Cymbomonas tetramitiformis]|uniref:Uncharacterized protein n=1 Tax=Cymbomonas tetramitiformis TaxID=36881 RepID=A0AAE0FT25_9CHLO|nr:hypothetical protein CYMTET_25834 [Cymbomonas tetramitiformis]